jgi:hypothetical protein
MSSVFYISKGFYALREGAYGLLRVYGTDAFGFRATILGSLEGFHSQADARLVVREWTRLCTVEGVAPFSREGIALCRRARLQSRAASQPMRKVA